MKDFIEINVNGLKLPATKTLHERLTDHANSSGKNLNEYIQSFDSYNKEKFKNIDLTSEEVSMLLALYDFCLDIEKKVKDAAINFMA
jgi:hypothetical protein